MPTINQRKLDKATELLRAIAHPLRISMIKYLDEKGVTNVNKIYSSLQLEQSITSQHLKILRTTDLVNTKKEGKFIFYNVNYDNIVNINQSLANFYPQTKKTKVKELVE
ncbi:MAG: helix-turn-helix transcriptional regulator [Sphingobacteriales bacterium]|nr:MAG: helix-turn-helix transcriptional regulator [Sphingobacteriales bacterium]